MLGIVERPSWPPPHGAVSAAQAQVTAEEFCSSDRRPHDVGLDYAWTTSATVQPWSEGEQFYPRILADIAAATSSIHILMFGWKDGDIGRRFADTLMEKLADGVEVRILVDSFGSRPYGASKDMYMGLVEAGAEIVVNDLLPPDRDGLYPARRIDLTHPETGRSDHRKLIVIDGTAMWTGGAGIEDHFQNGEFHDVVVRVTGDIVLQAQAVFLTSFASHSASVPSQLDRYFPLQPRTGEKPTALVQVVPGGFVSASQSVRELLDSAERRLDIMNPYLTDASVIDRIVAAAERGVTVRIVVSPKSNSLLASAALRHHYERLVDAGVRIFEYPNAVVHAKLILSDDRVQFGTVNLDAWALYRNFEFALIVEDPATVEVFRQQVFRPDIALCQAGTVPTGSISRAAGWVGDKLEYFL